MVNLVFADPQILKCWLEASPGRQAAIYRIHDHFGALAESEVAQLLQLDDAEFMRYEWQLVYTAA